MTLNIKDPETHKLVQELAHKTGQSMSKAVKEAVREKLDAMKSRKRKRSMSEDLLAIGRRCASRMKRPFLSSDELLYDERGLPK